MLLCWQTVTLSGQLGESAADAETGVAWLNHIIDIAILGCLVGVGE